MDVIIQRFNERWFQAWELTPEEQRVKLVTLSKQIQSHPDFEEKFLKNRDEQNRNLALKKIMDDTMRNQRKNELDFYKLYAKDDAFYQAIFDTMKRMTDLKNLK